RRPRDHPGPDRQHRHRRRVSSPELHGVGVLVVRDGKVVIGRRTSPHGRGTWSAPGGKAEPGETDEETARRELLEETGLLGAVPAAWPRRWTRSRPVRRGARGGCRRRGSAARRGGRGRAAWTGGAGAAGVRYPPRLSFPW